MGFLNEDFVGHPNRPDMVEDDDELYLADEDEQLHLLGLQPGDPDFLIQDNFDIVDEDSDYDPEDDYEDFLSDSDFDFDSNSNHDEEEDENQMDELAPDNVSSSSVGSLIEVDSNKTAESDNTTKVDSKPNGEIRSTSESNGVGSNETSSGT